MNVVICCDEKSLPGPCDKYFLEEDLRHVQGWDDRHESNQLQNHVQILENKNFKIKKVSSGINSLI